MKIQHAILFGAMVSLLTAATLEERVGQLEKQLKYYDEMEEIVEEIEKKSFQDRINLSSELRFRVDQFNYRLTKLKTDREKAALAEVDRDAVEGDPFEKHYEPHYAVMLRLNMTAQLEEDAKFFARLVGSRSSQNHQRLCILSREITAEPENKNMAFDFDRAYFDLKFADSGSGKYYLSAGVLPTSGGSSSNIIENAPRKSMFPSLMFDSNVMGAILTADLSSVTGVEKSFARAIGGKAFTLNPGQFYYQCNRETIENMDVAGLFFETRVPALGENILYIGANRAGNIKATPYLGSSSASVDIKTLDSLGDITNYGAGFEVHSIASVWDFFLHYALSHPEGNGNRLDAFVGTIDTADVDGDGDTSEVLNALGNPAYTNASYAGGELLKEDGYAFHTGFRHALCHCLKWGVEYNRGSKYWWSATQGSEDVFNKLATRGEAVEAYINYFHERTINFRVGYLGMHEEYTGSGWHFGEPVEKSGDQHNYYLMITTRF